MRKVGIQGLNRQLQTQKQYQAVGQTIASEQMKQMQAQLAIFKQNLEEFAKKHKKDINKNPEFRKYFQDMCSKIGVDPLASNKGFWAEMLGVGDFYYELGVQIIEGCVRTRSSNGGLIEIRELLHYLCEIRPQSAQAICEDDIERSIKKLKVLGNGFNLLNIGSKKMVQSVPCELNTDHTTVLLIAQDKGYVEVLELEKELLWPADRIVNTLDLLLKQGIAWIDVPNVGKQLYWFPSLFGGTLKEWRSNPQSF